MSIYYTVIDDFSNIDPNIGQLDTEIRTYMTENPSNITKVFHGISKYLNEIDISLPPYIELGKTIVEFHFDIILSGSEKTLLDGLISSHVAIFTIYTKENINIQYYLDTSKHSSYRRVIKPISVPAMSYGKCKTISYMDPSMTSYDIKIFDKTHNTVVLETNLTNTEETEQPLGTLSNLSTDPWILEVFVKRNGGSNKNTIFLESIKICYNEI